ncbi:hypothetical protein, partial [Holospora undulata]|uniref:hypothetical protein n=1 Tax=Holospora undulata TaxID=1169117 RepID=UPI0005578E3F
NFQLVPSSIKCILGTGSQMLDIKAFEKSLLRRAQNQFLVLLKKRLTRSSLDFIEGGAFILWISAGC